MAEPLSITTSVTAAIHSTKSLYETIKCFEDRSRTLRRLQEELQDLANILDSVTQVNNTEISILALLQRPTDRWSQVCREFEQSIKVFSRKPKVGFRDWTKMEFMGGDINEFIDIIAGYKSTISVCLATINMLVTTPCPLLTLLTSCSKTHIQCLARGLSRVQGDDRGYGI